MRRLSSARACALAKSGIGLVIGVLRLSASGAERESAPLLFVAFNGCKAPGSDRSACRVAEAVAPLAMDLLARLAGVFSAVRDAGCADGTASLTRGSRFLLKLGARGRVRREMANGGTGRREGPAEGSGLGLRRPVNRLLGRGASRR